MRNSDVVNSAVPQGVLSMLFWNEAKAYVFAAKTLVEDKQTKTPTYFLLGHALELTLKAYLAAQGIKFVKLKDDIGHDVAKAYRKAVELGLKVDCDFLDAEKVVMLIQLLSDFHKEYVFRYPTISDEGRLVVIGTLVKADDVLRVVTKIWHSVLPEAGHARLMAASEGGQYLTEEWHMGRGGES
jgi:hypothetical protein